MKTLLLIPVLLLLSSCSSQNKKSNPLPPKTAVQTSKKLTPEVKVESSISCNLAKNHRLLEIVKTDKGCELFYTRDGDKISKATSENGVSHCEKVAQNIKNNLSTAGFKCNQ